MIFGQIVILTKSGEEGVVYPITSDATIGRSDNCDIRIQLSSVAEEHCRVELISDTNEVRLHNLSATNPTLLNGQEFVNGVVLKSNDKISFSGRDFIFQDKDYNKNTKHRSQSFDESPPARISEIDSIPPKLLSDASNRRNRSVSPTSSGSGDRYNIIQDQDDHADQPVVPFHNEHGSWATMPNPILSRIFAYLPPLDRLHVSEVCTAWLPISRAPWNEVRNLDLSNIPYKQVAPIIKQCPKLVSLFARGIAVPIILRDFAGVPPSLTSVKVYDCWLWGCHTGLPYYADPRMLFGSVPRNTGDLELILHNVDFLEGSNIWSFRFDNSVTVPITKLQLSGLDLSPPFGPLDIIVSSLSKLRSLTCLILTCDQTTGMSATIIGGALFHLSNLRELLIAINTGEDQPWEACAFVPGATAGFELAYLMDGLMGLRSLSVLGLSGSIVVYERGLQKLVCDHPALRILVVAGEISLLAVHGVVPVRIEMPVRSLLPKGDDGVVLQPLHVFLGKTAAQLIQFPAEPGPSITIHEITKPMPEFLG